MQKILITLLLFPFFVKAQTQQKLKTPPNLKKGDEVIILAPAGVVNDKESIIKAQKLLESWGLKVSLGDYLFSRNNHFAGTDEQRCTDFQNALDNPKIKAIWCARGGYGSARIIDLLNFEKFKKKPKWIIGYSDITVFHNHIHTLGVETMHGMMAGSLKFDPEKTKESIQSFKNALFGKQNTYTINHSKYNRLTTNKISGELIGGNLTILNAMLGSKSQLNTANKILFVEEIGEYKYAIDRMLQSLKRAQYFNNIKAIIVGDMSNIKKNGTSWGTNIEQLILNAIPSEIPVFFNMPAGHEIDNRTLIFGRNITIHVRKKSYSISL